MVTALVNGYPCLRKNRDKKETSDLGFLMRMLWERCMIRALNWRSRFHLQLRIFLTCFFNIVNQG